MPWPLTLNSGGICTFFPLKYYSINWKISLEDLPVKVKWINNMVKFRHNILGTVH